MDDDENPSPGEVDDLFNRTQPIGDMIHALAEAELTVAAADELDPEAAAVVDRILRQVIDPTRD